MIRTALALILLLVAVQRAAGDVGSSLQDAWSAAGGTLSATGPVSFQGQGAGYYTLGNLRARTPIRQVSLSTISLPSVNAGCGGIDIYGGAFSHIDASEFVRQLKLISNNAQGFAFQLALRTLAPSVEQVMATLGEKIDQINSLNINSCQSAQALVGGLWPRSAAASDVICSSAGAGKGALTDYARAKHACGENATRNQNIITANASAAEKEQLPDGNYAWMAMRSRQTGSVDWLEKDKQLAEFLMTLTGTVIINGTKVDHFGPRLVELDKKNDSTQAASPLVALVEGGSVDALQCDTADACLIPTFAKITILPSQSFLGRVSLALDNVLAALADPYSSVITANQQAVITATDLPVYKILNMYNRRTGPLIDLELDKIKRAIAWEMALDYVMGLLTDMEVKGVFTAHAGRGDQQMMDKWRADAAAAYRQFAIERGRRRAALKETFRFLAALEVAERAAISRTNFGAR